MHPGLQGFGLKISGQANLDIVQIAGRIGRPGVTRRLICPHPGITTANSLIGTGPAASLEWTGTGFETVHERIGTVLPDSGERPLLDITEVVIPPERIRVNIADIIDIGDIHAGAVTTPLFELGAQMRNPLRREPLRRPVQ